MTYKSMLGRAVLSCSLLSFLAPAHAQEMPAEALADDGALGDIVVTAQKREETLQKAPISMIAMTSAMLERERVTGLGDLVGLAPGLQIQQHGNNATTLGLTIRGVGMTDDQVTLDPAVGVYIDGIYVARSQGLALSMADIERIEVLRGPQGSLYGRNTTGGAINFITRKPDFGGLSGVVTASAGNLDERQLRAGVNVPLSGNIAARVDYFINKRDGFIANSGTAFDSWAMRDRQAWRADVLWEAQPGLTLRYVYDRALIKDTPNYYVHAPAGLSLPARPASGKAEVRDLLPMRVLPQGHALTAGWAIADGMKLTSLTAWRTNDTFQNQDYLSGVLSPLPAARNFSTVKGRQFSQEIQLAGEVMEGDLQYVLGGYYFVEQGRSSATSLAPRNNQVNYLTGYSHARSYALFGQVDWRPDFAEGLTVTVGGRYSSDERRATYSRDVHVGCPR